MVNVEQFWLLKSEPEVYSIDQFKREERTLWTGIRNYQARNYMMSPDSNGPPGPRMNPGDLFFFYHSNAEPPCITGVGRVDRVSVVDPDQFNKKKETFDPKATKSKPIWFCAEVSFVKKFSRPIALDELRADPRLKDMVLLRRGSRLSVQPVSKLEFRAILDTAERSDSSSHRPNDQL